MDERQTIGNEKPLGSTETVLICVECSSVIPGTSNWFCTLCRAVLCERCLDGSIHKCDEPTVYGPLVQEILSTTADYGDHESDG